MVPSTIYYGDGSYGDLDGAGERYASIFLASKTGNISVVYVFTNIVTIGKTIHMSIQSVNSAGQPSGTILGATNSGYGTVTIDNADDYVWKTVTLGEVVPVTKGTYYAVVVKWNNDADVGSMRVTCGATHAPNFNNIYGTSDTAATATSGVLVVGTTYKMYAYAAGDDFSNVFAEGAAANVTGFEGIATGTTPTTWTNASQVRKWANANTPVIVDLKYDDDTHVGNVATNYQTVSVGTGSTPDEVGNYFKTTFPFRAIGFYARFDADYTLSMSLLAADDTVLANSSHTGSIYRFNSGGTQYNILYFDGDPAHTVNIVAGTYYRVILTMTSASTQSVALITFPEAASMNSLSLGTDCVMTSATNRDAVDDWSQTTTSRIVCGLIGDQLDDGASTGGSSPRFGDMTGGLR